MRFGKNKSSENAAPLPISALTDVVFLLLIFFVMTLNIAPIEGNLPIMLPRAPGEALAELVPQTLNVRVTAKATGELREITCGANRFQAAAELNHFVRELVSEHLAAGGTRQELAVVLDCDDALHFQHTIDTLTAVRGYVDEEGTHDLIHEVQLAGRASRN